MRAQRSRYLPAAIFICVCGLATLAWMYSSVDVYSAATALTIAAKQHMLPSRKLVCPVDAVLCNVNERNSADFESLRSEFYRLMTTIDFQCPTVRRFGGGTANSFGYDACMSKAIRPDNSSCLVYSFGISGDWSFDEAWARFGCEVHSFDPSIGQQDHMHAPNISFHNLGLWGSDYTTPNGWKLERLSTIKKGLGHEKRIIDHLKIDVEGAEWPFLRDVIYMDPQSLSNIKQLVMELHTPRFKSDKKSMTAADFAEINDYIRRLSDELHFKMFESAHNDTCCGAFANLMPPGVEEKCCYEVHYLNPRLFGI